jgi:single-strand DNA-binding protein
MMDVNKVILVGRLGAEPVQRETKAGNPVTSFSLATSRRVRVEGDAEGQPTGEETVWHRVVVWGRQGETCAQYLHKGHAVYVEGAVRSRKYDAKDGTQRTTFEVHADVVSFLGGAGARRPEGDEPRDAAADPLAIAAAG